MGKLDEMLRTLKESVENIERINTMLGREICLAVAPVIKLDFSLGWEEAGPDTLCFWCPGRRVLDVKLDDVQKGKYVRFAEIVEEVFPELKVDTPYGVYVTRDEARRIRAALKRLRRRLNE